MRSTKKMLIIFISLMGITTLFADGRIISAKIKKVSNPFSFNDPGIPKYIEVRGFTDDKEDWVGCSITYLNIKLSDGSYKEIPISGWEDFLPQKVKRGEFTVQFDLGTDVRDLIGHNMNQIFSTDRAVIQDFTFTVALWDDINRHRWYEVLEKESAWQKKNDGLEMKGLIDRYWGEWNN